MIGFDYFDDRFDVKIIGKSRGSYMSTVAYCDPYEECMYIRKPSKKFDDLTDYTTDIVIHEYMHYIICKMEDEETSKLYDKICYEAEDRKFLTDRSIVKLCNYD